MKFLKPYLLALLVFNLAGCASFQTVSIENAMQGRPTSGLDYGSLVQVTTLDRQTARFRVTELTADGVGNNENFYRYEDMASLKVEGAKSNSTEVWPYIVGILGAAALVLVVANADSVEVCSPSPCNRP